MTTPLEHAFPNGANWVAGVVRSKLAEQSIFCTTQTDLSAENFTIQPYAAIAVFGGEGDLECYAYDAADTTTADDGGLSCIIVSGRRYKRRGEAIVRDAALSATTSAQPATPSLGDTYIVPVAPSGDDWASHADEIATFTARGWLFRQPFIGMLVYVSDEDGFYHFDSNGDWVQGLPIGALPAGSVTPSTLAEPFAILKVEDQRNAPPGGPPVAGTMYQVGTSPTGGFAGQANKVARWTGSAYVFIAPAEGDTVYRKDQQTLFTYRSGMWVRTIAASGVQQIKRKATFSALNSVGATIVRDPGIDITSQVGKWLRFNFSGFSATMASGGAAATIQIRLYADTSSSEIATLLTLTSADANAATGSFDFRTFYYQVPDNVSHNYNIGAVRTAGPLTRNVALSGTMAIEEVQIV